MSLEEWQAFLALGEQLHFARSADTLGLSQPALSKRIQKLEEQIGCRLFERSQPRASGKQRTSLTRLGAQLLPRARDCLQQFELLEAQARSLAAGRSGQLRIGFGFHTLELVPRLLLQLRQTHPDIQIELRDMSTQEQLQALHENQIDLGFLRLPVDPAWESRPVSQDEVVLVSPLSAPLALLQDGRERPFVLISSQRSPTLYEHSLRLCALCGFQPRVVQQVPEVTTALALVRAGMGVSLLPGSFVRSHVASVHVSSLEPLPATWQVGAAWHPQDSNPVLRSFLRLLGEGPLST